MIHLALSILAFLFLAFIASIIFIATSTFIIVIISCIVDTLILRPFFAIRDFVRNLILNR